jgi:hypothetical protein
MRKRSGAFIVLTLFSCWLVLQAAGDDFNLVRVALPSVLTPAPGDTVPLDDPNADFTEATASQVPAVSGPQSCPAGKPAGTPARKTARLCVLPSPVGCAFRDSMLTPLRC